MKVDVFLMTLEELCICMAAIDDRPVLTTAEMNALWQGNQGIADSMAKHPNNHYWMFIPAFHGMDIVPINHYAQKHTAQEMRHLILEKFGSTIDLSKKYKPKEEHVPPDATKH